MCMHSFGYKHNIIIFVASYVASCFSSFGDASPWGLLALMFRNRHLGRQGWPFGLAARHAGWQACPKLYYPRNINWQAPLICREKIGNFCWEPNQDSWQRSPKVIISGRSYRRGAFADLQWQIMSASPFARARRTFEGKAGHGAPLRKQGKSADGFISFIEEAKQRCLRIAIKQDS